MYTVQTTHGEMQVKGFVEAASKNPYTDFWRRFSVNSTARIGLMIIALVVLLAIFADIISPFIPTEGFSSRSYRGLGPYIPPTLTHLFGTSVNGTDLFSMIIHGTRISLMVGIVSVGVATVVGVGIGAIAGYFGGRIDDILMRFTDINIIMPDFFVMLMVIALFGQKLINIMIIIGLLSWEGLARLVRAEFLSLREREFVEAARALGARDRTIIFKHILPNAMNPVIVSVSLRISGAILTESALSFLGLGDSNVISWGGILTDAQSELVSGRFWLSIFPGLAIFITVIAFNMIGDGVRDALDPKMKNKGLYRGVK